ncbi:MAG: ABC transporter ATP-binding protein [Clostridium sp.]|uniref:ABC transporter ATP-binding protein n=1 Tax=Clostridium sp. TaxID=1506 RepID=UPI003029BECF
MKKVLFEVENLRVCYGNTEIIKNINLKLKSGTLTGFLGLNGTGKTTMLKAICGLIPCEVDSCRACGEEIANLSEKKKACYISYVPQRSNFTYNISTIDVVSMGFNPYLKLMQSPSKKQKEQAAQVLKSLSLEEKIHVDYQKLSGGQQQLVILARAIVQNTPIMFFDEPDSALDFPNHHLILNKIGQVLKENNSCGLITIHDPNYALTYCDEILLLKDGAIVESIEPKTASKDEIKKKLSTIYKDIEIIDYKKQYYMVKEV